MGSPSTDYIILNRSILDWEWYEDLPVRVLFQHLLLIVNWKAGKFHGTDILPGQVPTSVHGLSKETGLSVQQVKTAISKLKLTGEITSTSTSKFTVVTVVNWAKWQCVQPARQPRINHGSTTDQPQINHGSTTIEEGKKLRREERTAIAVPRATTPEEFKAQCAEVAAEHPDLLPPSLRKGFFDYWTERDARGRMRLQAEKHFEIPRRMTTWRANAEKRGEIVAPSPERKTGWLTPDGK